MLSWRDALMETPDSMPFWAAGGRPRGLAGWPAVRRGRTSRIRSALVLMAFLSPLFSIFSTLLSGEFLSAEYACAARVSAGRASWLLGLVCRMADIELGFSKQNLNAAEQSKGSNFVRRGL